MRLNTILVLTVLSILVGCDQPRTTSSPKETFVGRWKKGNTYYQIDESTITSITPEVGAYRCDRYLYRMLDEEGAPNTIQIEVRHASEGDWPSEEEVEKKLKENPKAPPMVYEKRQYFFSADRRGMRLGDPESSEFPMEYVDPDDSFPEAQYEPLTPTTGSAKPTE